MGLTDIVERGDVIGNLVVDNAGIVFVAILILFLVGLAVKNGVENGLALYLGLIVISVLGVTVVAISPQILVLISIPIIIFIMIAVILRVKE